jgi:hypothetical protein
MNAPARPLPPFLRPSKAGHCFGRNELVWDGLQLRVGSKAGRVMATLEPDARWPGMWRVRFGGELSDMVNLARAKDTAASTVLRQLNADYRTDTRKGLQINDCENTGCQNEQ